MIITHNTQIKGSTERTISMHTHWHQPGFLTQAYHKSLLLLHLLNPSCIWMFSQTVVCAFTSEEKKNPKNNEH